MNNTFHVAADSKTDITLQPQPSEQEIQFILDAIAEYLTVAVRHCIIFSWRKSHREGGHTLSCWFLTALFTISYAAGLAR